MATLFERIIGVAEDAKIPIHGIKALMGEVSRGRLAPADIVIAYALTPQQQQELFTFLTKLNAHPNKVYAGQVMFDWLALAEIDVLPAVYRNEAAFWARLDAEIALANG